MRIHEAAEAVGCTQRAIKLYEEKGLLPPVARCENGYRDYSEEDIRILHEIQAYRKLGVSLSDIGRLLAGDRPELLESILADKRQSASAQLREIEALEAYIAHRDAMQLDSALDYGTIASALRAQLPGPFGRYLAAHFEPYLPERITSEEQQDAYERILAFWDNPGLHLPLLYRISMLFSSRIPGMSAAQADAAIQSMLHPSEEQYERIKEQTLRTVRMRENPLIRYSPIEVLKRRMMRSLRDCGYYDIFIPQMKRLSPAYKAYQDAMQAMNDRLCNDLGLYYDAGFHLRLKKMNREKA